MKYRTRQSTRGVNESGWRSSRCDNRNYIFTLHTCLSLSLFVCAHDFDSPLSNYINICKCRGRVRAWRGDKPGAKVNNRGRCICLSGPHRAKTNLWIGSFVRSHTNTT